MQKTQCWSLIIFTNRQLQATIEKTKLYHFHNGAVGGVHSVICNLVKFSQNPHIENHVIYTINKDTHEAGPVNKINGALSEQHFYYSPKWNFYYTCKQLAKLLPGKNVVIVAHDWIELGMASNLGLQNPVVHVLHGDFDYYYELAAKHSQAINAYICISPKIEDTLEQKLPSRKDDIFYLKFPVPPIKTKLKTSAALHLIYYVRDLKEDRKQFSTILKIAGYLSDCADDYFFTIAGGGITAEEFFERWPAKMKTRVNYIGLKTNEEIVSLLPGQDIFLLPSLAEGFPVSLVEAMKAGVVPLVTNWGNAVDELVIPGTTGHYFDIGDAGAYALCIKELNINREKLAALSENCIKNANTLFDPIINVKKFEDIFIEVRGKNNNKKKAVKIYGSRLDLKWMPNWLVSTIRKLTSNKDMSTY